MSSSNEDSLSNGSEPVLAVAPETKGKEKSKRVWNRGKLYPPGVRPLHCCYISKSLFFTAKRAKQFADVMTVRGDVMWCMVCDSEVSHKEKSHGTNHIKSKKHQDNVKKNEKAVKKAGPAAQLSWTGIVSSFLRGENHGLFTGDGTFKVELKEAAKDMQSETVPTLRQMDLGQTFAVQKEDQKIADDFVAAFLQSGIPLAKLNHPSMRGLLKKYTDVSGCIPTNPYKSVSRVSEVHKAAVRKELENRQVWIAMDEWTTDSGIAVLNILMGCSGKVYVTDVVHIECKGKQLGVEHGAVGKAVIDNLAEMGVQSKQVYAVISDSAAVLKKAFEEVLRPVLTVATWVPCASHILNNCAKVCVTCCFF